MVTKKITLHELRNIVKTIINEEQANKDKYAGRGEGELVKFLEKKIELYKKGLASGTQILHDIELYAENFSDDIDTSYSSQRRTHDSSGNRISSKLIKYR